MSRAQWERDAKAYWDSLTLEQEAWVLRKMRLRRMGVRTEQRIGRRMRSTSSCRSRFAGQTRSRTYGQSCTRAGGGRAPTDVLETSCTNSSAPAG
jgi:hypothetical protein